METVLREEGTIEVKLASAAEQSRNVSREEEDAIRSGEYAVGWIEYIGQEKDMDGEEEIGEAL